MLLLSFTICVEIGINFTHIIQMHFIRKKKLPTGYRDLRNYNPFSIVKILKGLNTVKLKVI